MLLQGLETTQILRDLAHQENFNLDMLASNEMQVLNEARFATPVVCVIMPDCKVQVGLSGCRNLKSKDPWDMCAGFARGTVIIAWVRLRISILRKVWQWGGDDIARTPSFPKPPNFRLHGVHRLVHCAGSGLVKALTHHHWWAYGRALVWVELFWDDIKLQCRTATAADCEQDKGGKKALRMEQNAAGARVRGQGWDCIADYLEGNNLLQVPVQVGGGGLQ